MIKVIFSPRRADLLAANNRQLFSLKQPFFFCCVSGQQRLPYSAICCNGVFDSSMNESS